MKTNIFQDSNLDINSSYIEIDNNALQISNLARIWYGLIPKKPMPWKILGVLTLLSIISFCIFQIHKSGIIMLAFFIIIILIIIIKNLSQLQQYAVNIEMSSSSIFCLTSKDEGFIYTAYKEMLKMIDKPQKESLKIDFGNGNIYRDGIKITPIYDSTNIVLGDGNFQANNNKHSNIVASGVDSNVNTIETPYDELLYELNLLLNEYRARNSYDVKGASLIVEAIEKIEKKSEEPMSKILGFVNVFMKDLAVQLSLSTILSILQ